MISRGPYRYDPSWSQLRDADGWSIANIPNPNGLGGPTDAENGRFLAASWDLARALAALYTVCTNFALNAGPGADIRDHGLTPELLKEARAALASAGVSEKDVLR